MPNIFLEAGEKVLLTNRPDSALEGSAILTSRRVVKNDGLQVSSVFLEKVDSTSVTFVGNETVTVKETAISIARILAPIGAVLLLAVLGVDSENGKAVCGVLGGVTVVGAFVSYVAGSGQRALFAVDIVSGSSLLRFGPWTSEEAQSFHAKVSQAIDWYRRDVRSVNVQQTVNVATGRAAIVAGMPSAPPTVETPRLEHPKTPRERVIEAARVNGGTITRAEALGALGGGSKENQEFLDGLVKSGEAAFDVGPSGDLLYSFPVVTESADSLDHKMLQVAEKRQGRLTATRAALDLGLPIARAEAALRAMVDDVRVRVEQGADGKTTFVFTELVE